MHVRTLLSHIKPAVVLGVAALFLIAILTLRNTGVYATVMWDEWEYDRYSRLLPLATADVPYYLYFFVYGVTKFFGEHFLTAAQFLNALFFAASLPCIYLVCRRVASENWALFVAIASVMGGISVYATHFVPEPMYFFGFWVMAWKLLETVDADTNPVTLGLGIGAALAVMSIIKLHGIFLVPGFILYFLICSWGGLIADKWRGFFKATFLMLASCAVVRFSLGYLFAGVDGFNLAGLTYTQIAQETPLSMATVVEVARNSLPYLSAQIAVVITMFAVPCLLMGTITARPANSYERRIFSLQALTVALLLPLLIITSLFMGRVSQLNPIAEGANGLLRLPLRYYDFLFPLFAILAAAGATESAPHPSQNAFSGRRLIAAAFISFISVALVYSLPLIKLSVFDAPELRGFATFHAIAYFLAGLNCIASFVWIRNEKLAAKLYLLLFFPILTLMGAAAATVSAHKEKTPEIAHLAGMFAKEYLKGDISKMVVIGDNFAANFQAMFYADNPNIGNDQGIPEHSCLTFTPAADGKEWVLLLGDYQLLSPVDQAIVRDGFKLVHTAPSVVSYRDCTDTSGVNITPSPPPKPPVTPEDQTPPPSTSIFRK